MKCISETAFSPNLLVACDIDQFLNAIKLLEKIAESRTEVVKRFLSGIETLNQLARIDLDDCAALAAGQVRIIFKPSDRLRDFLAACAAGDFDCM
jgi:hypothetical protein